MKTNDHSHFGYEDLVPLFKAEKWNPEVLVKFVKEKGARFFPSLELGGHGAASGYA
jgi:alpha-L-fucosidase